MPNKIAEPTLPPQERAFLVGVEMYGEASILNLEDSMAELALLAETAGLEVVGETFQRIDKPNSVTYIGSGKVEEIKAFLEETLADIVIFDVELSPRHQRELEKSFGLAVRIVDRTALILDIFAQHAHTREGKLQVELAQYDYRLPRLTRAWTHLARQAGGGGGRTGSTGGVGLRGPGETQLEVDRREVRHRIAVLKEELEKVRAHRARYRIQRKRTKVPVIALVGYTNSGKSTLLNHLARTNVFVANQLFATLDPTTRRIELPGNHSVLLTDTVGFIQKLPTQLVAAFRATLEEITEADLLIHMVDISHPNAMAQCKSVQQTLMEIGANQIPIITALNKLDTLPDPLSAQKVVSEFFNSVAISALTGQGISDLLLAIESTMFGNYMNIKVRIPYQEGRLISIFHEQGQINFIEHGQGGVFIHGLLPGRLIASFKPFVTSEKPKAIKQVKNEK